MANTDITPEVMQLRNQGLTDSLIMEELTRKGYPPEQVHIALSQLESQEMAEPQPASYPDPFQGQRMEQPQTDVYSRMEEIAESLIDEKWDQLLSEVKKIVAWKEQVEDTQRRLSSDVARLKEDFKVLHQGVLGKLEDYDGRMQEVGTELKAVGKVFKDVIPVFVDNVKELSHIRDGMKKK
ncbi:hypothetical protein COV20_02520 [Candidatus Woesearchaeota archaeon CG10_big_fil_rev_8_21_14_0_10_45_16]|nr:MAG: hypothetical protein COV20_02520 [Candidatus Woesearchaeota archaeon CG10_big_fil_rev_8_21_14_0_10_45_16]